MPDAQKEFLKRNGITLANFVLILGGLITIITWKSAIDNEIKANAKHRENTEMHMPFRESIKIFVPRSEMDMRLEILQETLDEIKENQNKSK